MNTNTVFSSFALGDMTVFYYKNSIGQTGFTIVPSLLKDRCTFCSEQVDPLVQLYIRGDTLAGDFLNGLSLSQTASSALFRYSEQQAERFDDGITIRTTLQDNREHFLHHRLEYRNHTRVITVSVTFENRGETSVVLENLSSFSIGNLTPFGTPQDIDKLRIHRAKSWWSAEGRWEVSSVEQLHLERSWSGSGTRMEKFGQTGSMPVRHYFPFLAVEDPSVGVTWAVQLACPSSWQIELRRNYSGLHINGGLADYEYGHWKKTIEPGACFETPSALLTAAKGSPYMVSQRLQDLNTCFNEDFSGKLPVIFNEFCTTWGNPTEENIRKIVSILQGRGVDYLVIDCGWYGDDSWENMGDWNLNVRKFPNGLQYAVDAIREAGMKPGIWFEMENCTMGSRFAKEHPDWLLCRHGTPINTGRRSFLNMSNPDVQDYLRSTVIDFLNTYGFRYIKVDYNDSIGMGCDHPEGLGEGLRTHMLSSQAFFRQMRSHVPGLVIENCSSGGHRLEPSMMALCDVASFSDAHECVSIPIIAANLHRLIHPGKSQIWAVLRKTDSIRRINYSLVNTLLGVMCLSGDVYDLSEEQWACTDRAIDFYKKYSPIICSGISSFFGPEIQNYGNPTGWQAVSRYNPASGQTLLIVHTFGGELPEQIQIPVNAVQIKDILCSENNEVTLQKNSVSIQLKENFEAIAIALTE